MTVDLNQAAAEAVVALFQRIAPDVVEVCEPFIYRLFAALQDGHTFIWLHDDEAAVLQEAAPLVARTGDAPLVLQGRRLFLGRIWQLERDLAREIVRLAKAALPVLNREQSRQNLADWFQETGSEGQQAAAALALLQPFMLISGGPGTGKTTTVAKLLALLCDAAPVLPRIALAAPTGKAAAHMARSLHKALARFAVPEAVKAHLQALDGQTVHRLLKLRPPQMQPQFDAESPLPLDILVVDEASMLDLSLLLNLLRAVPNGCRVVLLGDEDQLPSVGAGAILAALAQPTVLSLSTAQQLAELLPHPPFACADTISPLAENIAHLTFSHRFGEHSGLGCLARAVTTGEAEQAWAQFAAFPQELHMKQANIAQQVAELYTLQTDYWRAVDANDVAAAFAHQTDVVVLAARRDDAAQFNEAYRRYLQQQGRVRLDMPWFAGQMIMIERNDYPLGLFNGDIGLILLDSTSATGALAAYFPAAEGFRKIALSRLPVYATAFAMTVHKSQGSEYRDVWLLPPTSEATEQNGLTRPLLYTAITRARETFVFWGKPDTFKAACLHNEQRRSALRDMIAKQFAWLSSPTESTE